MSMAFILIIHTMYASRNEASALLWFLVLKIFDHRGHRSFIHFPGYREKNFSYAIFKVIDVSNSCGRHAFYDHSPHPEKSYGANSGAPNVQPKGSPLPI